MASLIGYTLILNQKGLPVSDITRHRPKAVWESKNPALRSGEFGFEEETGKLKQGDGTKRWSELPYLDVVPYTLPKPPPLFGEEGGSGGDVAVVVNNDGTFNLTGSDVVDNGNGTFTVAA